MRIYTMITQRKMLSSFVKFSLLIKLFFDEMYGDQSEEFLRGHCGLTGLNVVVMELAICGPSDIFWYTKRFLSDSNIIITLFRVVTKMSSGQVNTTRRQGISQLGVSFGSIFLLFSFESSQGPHSQQYGEIPGPRLSIQPCFCRTQ